MRIGGKPIHPVKFRSVRTRTMALGVLGFAGATLLLLGLLANTRRGVITPTERVQAPLAEDALAVTVRPTTTIGTAKQIKKARNDVKKAEQALAKAKGGEKGRSEKAAQQCGAAITSAAEEKSGQAC